MSIYDRTENGIERIVYDGKGFASSTRVLHFGSGDILIHENLSDSRSLMFSPASPHRIGEHAPATGEPVVPPVEMLFDGRESIDVLIERLQKLAANFE